jgi:hypothetical protein
MTSKKLIVALALFLSATSATLAKDNRQQNPFGSGAGASSGYDPSAATQR